MGVGQQVKPAFASRLYLHLQWLRLDPTEIAVSGRNEALVTG
jgi:hypothetical protein